MMEDLMYETAAVARFPDMPGIPAPPCMPWSYDDTCRVPTDGGSWTGFIAERDAREDIGTSDLEHACAKTPLDRSGCRQGRHRD